MNRFARKGLLAATAGIALASGAQAADMPVKAKAVEYVKICSAGAGFYYIPGTDICLRVGGYVFVETGVKGRNAAVDVIYPSGSAQFDSGDNYMQWRARGHVILDARQNTAYGTLRAYFVGGVSYATINSVGGNGVQAPAGTNTAASLDRAFIEFAGFTAGFTESFFSFGGAYSIVASGSLPWDWLPLIAYTAQLGDGVTATVSLEDAGARRSTMFGNVAMGYGGTGTPDIIGNVRMTQAWGSAQIMGALHELKTSVVSLPGTAWGYAVGAGIEVKTPQTGNPNNSFLLQAQYTKGAVEYTGLAASPVTTVLSLGFVTGATGATTFIADAVGLGTTLHKTTAWSAYGGYRHYWTPALRTGLSAGITDIDYDAAVTAQLSIVDARLWQGHISTIWSPVAGLDLSLDLVYSNVQTSGCSLPTTACPGTEDIWTAWTRIRRNF